MPAENVPLPEFDSPPVVETVMGVHFRPLPRLTAAQQGILWDRHFRDDFPTTQERSPLDEVIERFGVDRLAPSPGFRWNVSDRPDTPRLWASSASNEHILQIQKNALLTNWQRASNENYLNYGQRRSEFESRLRTVERFVVENELGEIEPTSCIITYINHIELDSLEKSAEVVQQCLTVWSNSTSDGWLPCPDEVRLHFAYPMPNDSGRLNVIANPVVRKHDRKPLIRLELTARGKEAEMSIDSALNWVDLGHEWIVRGFASITRSELHQVWGRTTQ